MDCSLRKSRKASREELCYLLTNSKSWVLGSELLLTSSSMISAYTDTLQLEGKTLIKEEVDVTRMEDENSATLQLQFVSGNYLENVFKVEMNKKVGTEETLYIKFEEDIEETNESEITSPAGDKTLNTPDGVVAMPCRKLNNEPGETTKEDMEDNQTNFSPQYLDPLSTVFGLIKTVNGVIHYECDFCAKVFKCRWRIIIHRRIHTNERIFKCDRCTKSFYRRDSLLKHVRKVHGAHFLTTKPTNGKHKCDMCTKTYKDFSSLKSHVRKHGHGEIGSRHMKKTKTVSEHLAKDGNEDGAAVEQIYKCDRCGKMFADGGWLLQHKKYECYYVALEAVRKNKLGNAWSC